MKKRKKIMRRRCVSIIILFILIMTVMVKFAFAKNTACVTFNVIVHRGDSVWSIAKENNPNNLDIRKLVNKIISVNNISDGNIYVGQTLLVPIN